MLIQVRPQHCERLDPLGTQFSAVIISGEQVFLLDAVAHHIKASPLEQSSGAATDVQGDSDADAE